MWSFKVDNDNDVHDVVVDDDDDDDDDNNREFAFQRGDDKKNV